MKIVISGIRRIRVKDCIYDFDVLAGGLETPPGKVCKIRLSEPRGDGSREVIFSTQDEKL